MADESPLDEVIDVLEAIEAVLAAVQADVQAYLRDTQSAAVQAVSGARAEVDAAVRGVRATAEEVLAGVRSDVVTPAVQLDAYAGGLIEQYLPPDYLTASGTPGSLGTCPGVPPPPPSTDGETPTTTGDAVLTVLPSVFLPPPVLPPVYVPGVPVLVPGVLVSLLQQLDVDVQAAPPSVLVQLSQLCQGVTPAVGWPPAVPPAGIIQPPPPGGAVVPPRPAGGPADAACPPTIHPAPDPGDATSVVEHCAAQVTALAGPIADRSMILDTWATWEGDEAHREAVLGYYARYQVPRLALDGDADALEALMPTL